MAGFFDAIKRRLGRPRLAPPRDTESYPNLLQIGRIGQVNRLIYKASPRNLRYFSRTPYARRAINAIKNPIKMLDWEIVPVDGVDWNSELKKQAEVATTCFQNPNESDDCQSLIEQVLEDYLICGGAVETQVGSDKIRPLWMWPVDGLSIQINSEWNGNPSSPHYAQTKGFGYEAGGRDVTWLRDDELMYVRPNPSTATPFGFGPLEIAFNSISRLLGVAEFAGNVASNARPSIGVDLGDMDRTDALAMRAYWTNEVEGQGKVPFFSSTRGSDGKATGVKVLRLHPEGDDALYLKYQEVLIRELAAAFDLSPQNFGIERDVNRNTSEVAEDRDWDQAIKPAANDIAKAFSRHCIQGRLGFSQLQFKFTGLDREDELATARILEIRYNTNSITPDEIRDKFGESPMESQWGAMTKADVEVAMAAARSAATVLDDDLSDQPQTKSPAATSKKSRTQAKGR